MNNNDNIITKIKKIQTKENISEYIVYWRQKRTNFKNIR